MTLASVELLPIWIFPFVVIALAMVDFEEGMDP